VSALAQPNVGQYLNRHFVSAFQKVATFKIKGAQKQGGNVASYFCSAEGRVLHAIAGPVNAETFLREARWAHETFQLAQLEQPTAAQLRASFARPTSNACGKSRTWPCPPTGSPVRTRRRPRRWTSSCGRINTWA